MSSRAPIAVSKDPELSTFRCDKQRSRRAYKPGTREANWKLELGIKSESYIELGGKSCSGKSTSGSDMVEATQTAVEAAAGPPQANRNCATYTPAPATTPTTTSNCGDRGNMP